MKRKQDEYSGALDKRNMYWECACTVTINLIYDITFLALHNYYTNLCAYLLTLRDNKLYIYYIWFNP